MAHIDEFLWQTQPGPSSNEADGTHALKVRVSISWRLTHARHNNGDEATHVATYYWVPHQLLPFRAKTLEKMRTRQEVNKSRVARFEKSYRAVAMSNQNANRAF